MKLRIGREGLGILSAVLLTAALAGSAVQSQPALAGSSNPSDHNKVPSDVKDLTDKLTKDLKKKHFEVAQGYMKLWTQSDCDKYDYPIMKSCFANNPAAPYATPVVPSWPDEFVDPVTRNVFGTTDPGYSVSRRVDPREAIVVFGALPPTSRYMGLQSYLFSQDGSVDTSSGALSENV